MSIILKLLWTCFLVVALGGCSLRTQTGFRPSSLDTYSSQLTDPASKALFAYAQFRLLAVNERWEEAVAALERALVLDPQSDYLHLNLARAYLQTERLDKAVETLVVLLERSPETLEARELLGEVYAYRKNFSKAVDQFREALRLDPENESLQVQLAQVLAQAGERGEAVSILEGLVADHPDASLARLSLARLYDEQDKREQALLEYQRLLDDNPGLQQAVLEYGHFLEGDDLQSAIDLYLEALKANPRALEIRRRLVQIYIGQHQAMRALEQLQVLTELSPGDIYSVVQTGLLHMELGHWAAAEEAFMRLKKTGEYRQRGFYYLALAQIELGKESQAIANLEQVDADSTVYPEALLRLVYLYQNAGRQDEALALLEQRVATAPQDANAHYFLVALLLDEQGADAALVAAQKAIENNPKSAALLYQYALIQERKQQRDLAVALMEKVLELDPDHVEALNFLAYHQAENDIDLDLALIRVNKALSQQRSGYIVDTLGWIYFKMGRYHDSRDVLEEAAALLPDDPHIVDHLGDVYSALEMWAEAKKAYQRVRELDAEFEGVEEKLKSLIDGDR
jgi:tetratricopeptide (TPR) repeat protein